MFFQGFDSSLGLDDVSKFSKLLIPEKALLLAIILQSELDIKKAYDLLQSPEYNPNLSDYQTYREQWTKIAEGILARRWIQDKHGFNAPAYSFDWCCDLLCPDIDLDAEKLKEQLRKFSKAPIEHGHRKSQSSFTYAYAKPRKFKSF